MLKISMSRNTIVQCGIAAVTSVAILSGLRVRPLCLFFLGVFGIWYYKTQCNLRVVPPPELMKQYEEILRKIRDWHHNYPAMSCAVAGGCLGALAALGHLLSGSTFVIIMLMLAGLISTKYNFKVIKIEPKDFNWAQKLNPDDEFHDEFLPDVNDLNIFATEQIRDKPSNEELNVEHLMPDVIPEVDESTTDDEKELVPVVTTSDNLTLKRTYSRRDSSSSEESLTHELQTTQSAPLPTDSIEFKKRHFRNDSPFSNASTTSSSEESLSKGLQIPDLAVVDGKSQQRSTIAEDAGELIIAAAVRTQVQGQGRSKFLPNLLTGFVQWSVGGGGGGGAAAAGKDANTSGAIVSTNSLGGGAAATHKQRRIVTALDSSDESDFEILDKEDFK